MVPGARPKLTPSPSCATRVFSSSWIMPSLLASRWILSHLSSSSKATTTSWPRRTAYRWAAINSVATSMTAEFIRNSRDIDERGGESGEDADEDHDIEELNQGEPTPWASSLVLRLESCARSVVSCISRILSESNSGFEASI